MNRRNTVIFLQLWVDNLKQNTRKNTAKNQIMVIKDVSQKKLISYLDVKCFTIYGGYTVE